MKYLIITLLCFYTLEAQSSFIKVFDYGINVAGASISEREDGSLDVIGGGMFFLRLFSDGGLDFSKNIVSAGDLYPQSFIRTGDNGYLITGMFVYGYNFLPFIIKLDENINFQWGRLITGVLTQGEGMDVVEFSGRYIILSRVESAYGFPRGLITEFDNNGNHIRSFTFEVADRTWPYSIKSVTDGFIIVGYSGFRDKIFVIKYDVSWLVQWAKLIDLDVNGGITATDIKVTSDGGYVITGNIETNIGTSYPYILKLDRNGNILWAKFLDVTPNSYESGKVIETQDKGYVVAGPVRRFEAYDAILIKFDSDGNYLWSEILGWSLKQSASDVIEAQDGGLLITGDGELGNPPWNHSNYLVAKFGSDGEICGGARAVFPSYSSGWTENSITPLSELQNPDIYSLPVVIDKVTPDEISFCAGPDEFFVDDPLSLAYNNSSKLELGLGLHLVYTNNQEVYYRKSDGLFELWEPGEIIGKGEFPGIALTSNFEPCVTWTYDRTLYFAHKQNGYWNYREFYFPHIINNFKPEHPSITVSRLFNAVDTVHILVRLYVPADGPQNYIKEISFPIDNPSQKRERIIDFSGYYGMTNLDFPSIAYSEPINDTVPGMLHAVWQHGDTIYYATREIGSPNWVSWKNQFGPQGANSSHPFVSVYGDSVFVVWQRIENGKEEIYRASAYIPDIIRRGFPPFKWYNLSRTPSLSSVYPVNTSGVYTLYAEEPFFSYPYDVFYRTKPDEPPYNISSSSENSIFIHSASKRLRTFDRIFTIWLEGDNVPYRIKYRKILIYSPVQNAFMASRGGDSIPSPYVLKRDTFFPDWDLPVDAGYENLKYAFPLGPGYEYRIRLIFYHQGTGKWRAKVKLDGRMARMVWYEAYRPETLDIWVPENYYDDRNLEINIQRKKGDYVTVHAVYVYRYDKEISKSVSGIQTMGDKGKIRSSGATFIKDKLKVPFERFDMDIFDITGRRIYRDILKQKDDMIYRMGSGTYIILLKDRETGREIKKKIIKIR